MAETPDTDLQRRRKSAACPDLRARPLAGTGVSALAGGLLEVFGEPLLEEIDKLVAETFDQRFRQRHIVEARKAKARAVQSASPDDAVKGLLRFWCHRWGPIYEGEEMKAHNGQNSDFAPHPKRTMAPFSFRHSVKSFSTKVNGAERAAQQGQTLARLRYISRPSAARVVERARVSPTDAETSQAAEAEAIRKKGRVAERSIVALPVEATAEQRVALERAFAERLTGGKAGYVFAIHDQNGNDLRNPHFHLVAFDAYERGGGRGRPRSVLGRHGKGPSNGQRNSGPTPTTT